MLVERVLSFLEKSTSIPSASASETDPAMERQVRQSVLGVKDEIDALKNTPDITNEQKKRIDALDARVVRVLGKITNRPTWKLNEIADISKLENGSYLFRTFYVEDKVDFSTRLVSNGTMLSITAPIHKDYIITCKNLVSGSGSLVISPIYVGDSCRPEDAKYIQPLFIRKNFELYGLSKEETLQVEKDFVLNHAIKTKEDCSEQKCVMYRNSTISFPLLGKNSTDKSVSINAINGEVVYKTK